MLINVKKREIAGKAVKDLRKNGMIPASIYGAQRNPSLSVEINETEVKKAFHENGYSKVFEVQIEGEAKPINVVFKEVQTHPVKGNFVHVSIHQIEMNKAISAEIPVVLVGTSPAVKNNLGLLIMQMEKVDVICLPKDLPEKIEIDVTVLENVGDSVTIEKLNLGKEIEFGHNMQKDGVIVYIAAPQKMEEATEAATTETAATTEEAKAE